MSSQVSKELNKKKQNQRRSNESRYKAQFAISETNKKKKMASYIRNHPEDQQAIARYEELYGPEWKKFNPTARARKRIRGYA